MHVKIKNILLMVKSLTKITGTLISSCESTTIIKNCSLKKWITQYHSLKNRC